MGDNAAARLLVVCKEDPYSPRRELRQDNDGWFYCYRRTALSATGRRGSDRPEPDIGCARCE